MRARSQRARGGAAVATHRGAHRRGDGATGRRAGEAGAEAAARLCDSGGALATDCRSAAERAVEHVQRRFGGAEASRAAHAAAIELHSLAQCTSDAQHAKRGRRVDADHLVARRHSRAALGAAARRARGLDARHAAANRCGVARARAATVVEASRKLYGALTNDFLFLFSGDTLNTPSVRVVNLQMYELHHRAGAPLPLVLRHLALGASAASSRTPAFDIAIEVDAASVGSGGERGASTGDGTQRVDACAERVLRRRDATHCARRVARAGLLGARVRAGVVRARAHAAVPAPRRRGAGRAAAVRVARRAAPDARHDRRAVQRLVARRR
jgi:hypothetical protein